MRIVRVFPKMTSYTPTDDYAFVGMPPFPSMIPEHDEVHISCTFTWDMDMAEELAYQWEGVTNKPVKLGGGWHITHHARTSHRGCMSEKASCSPQEDATIIALGAVSEQLRGH